MRDLTSISVKIRNYKCFADEPQGFESIYPINLVIGRNNTGKSTLLELIGYVLGHDEDLSPLGYRGQKPEAIISKPLSKDELLAVFRKEVSGGDLPGNHWEFGKKWIGKRFTWSVIKDNGRQFVEIDPPLDTAQAADWHGQLVKTIHDPFDGLKFKRLTAERDIRPEGETTDLKLLNNGSGLTSLVRHFTTSVTYPSDLVEKTFLEQLNKIVHPDANFTDIVVQQHDNKEWELFLEEEGKARVALSHTGSGFKTVILVLSFINLIPYHENTDLKNYIFGFEELENNMHPSLQRRLLLYLEYISEKYGCHFFLTTHSSVAIDFFSNKINAQAIHLVNDGRTVTARRVQTYVDNKGILDDLDIRASDLLQANAIVWVEGPSDRLYFNRWVDLVSDGEVREGMHYTCVFYGGRLLAHLSADSPGLDIDDAVKILRVNRNAIVLMDSDRKTRGGRLSKTKERIKSEIEDVGGKAWITRGREVENYIPVAAIKALYQGKSVKEVGQYEDFPQYLDTITPVEGDRFKRKKVLFAERVCPHISGEGITEVLDLESQVMDCIRRIRAWNGSC